MSPAGLNQLPAEGRVPPDRRDTCGVSGRSVAIRAALLAVFVTFAHYAARPRRWVEAEAATMIRTGGRTMRLCRSIEDVH